MVNVEGMHHLHCLVGSCRCAASFQTDMIAYSGSMQNLLWISLQCKGRHAHMIIPKIFLAAPLSNGLLFLSTRITARSYLFSCYTLELGFQYLKVSYAWLRSEGNVSVFISCFKSYFEIWLNRFVRTTLA